MEQHNAMLKYLNSFPPGYKFRPTDEELVIHYLKNKVSNKPLPPNKILDIKLYEHGPQDLSAIYRDVMCTEKEEKIMYFFTPRDRKYPKGSRPSRSAGFGYWKATGVDNIIGRKANPVGYRKSLVYYQGTSRRSTKTNWLMHEYTIDQKRPSRSGCAAPNDMKLDDWVLCRVYLKEKKSDESNDQRGNAGTDTDTNINGSTSYAPPLPRNNNFGSTSSAGPSMEATNYNSFMQDPQLTGFGYSTLGFLEEVENDLLPPMTDYNLSPAENELLPMTSYNPPPDENDLLPLMTDYNPFPDENDLLPPMTDYNPFPDENDLLHPIIDYNPPPTFDDYYFKGP